MRNHRDPQITNEITLDEYRHRLTKLRESMTRDRLDAVVLTEETNIRWLSGYWVLIMQDGWSPTAVIVPAADDREPVLIIGAEATGEPFSLIEEIRYWEDQMNPDLTVDKSRVLVDCIRRYPFPNARIGFELGNGMRMSLEQGDIDSLRNHLSGFEFVDASRILWELKSIKSASEIEKIRRASSITTESFRSGFRILREGITERELAQHFGRCFFEHGATGISHIMVGFGRHAVEYAHCVPKTMPLRRGDIACVDLGCTFEGYRTDMYRLACVGRPSDEEARLADLIHRANQAMIRCLRPGMLFSELYRVGAELFAEEKLSHLLPSSIIGHGVGLGLHEWPFIAKDSTDTVKAGMVLAVEPWTVDYRDRSLGLNVEDVVAVTEDGCEVLTDFPREVYVA